MKRRFRGGFELDDERFHAQEWTHGQLEKHSGAMYLSKQGRHNKPPPDGVLHRSTIKACFSNTISFAGIEQEGQGWHAQVWFCEIFRGGISP